MVALLMLRPLPMLIGPETVKSIEDGSAGTAGVPNVVLRLPAERVINPPATSTETPVAVIVSSLPSWATTAELMVRLAAPATVRLKLLRVKTSEPFASGWLASV